MTLERHPGNLPGTPPWRTRGRVGLKGTCPSISPSARGAGRGGEDAGGGRGPCTHPALVPPGLNLNGLITSQAHPVTPRTGWGPEASLTRAARPSPTQRAHSIPSTRARPCSSAPGAAGRWRSERHGSARSRLGVPGYRRSPRLTGGLRAGIPMGLDGLTTRGRALILGSSRRGDAYPFAGTGTGGLWPGSPSCGPAAPALSRR